jgi:uncharacterized protein YecT (DUF1311 family)
MVALTPLLGQKPRQFKKLADCDKTAQTQADLNECGSDDYKTADDELNATYQRLLKRAASDPLAIQKIKAAQRAWVAYRDAQIEALYPAENKQAEYGTVFPMCANLALADLTRQRAKILKQMLNPFEGDVCASGSWYSEQGQRNHKD